MEDFHHWPRRYQDIPFIAIFHGVVLHRPGGPEAAWAQRGTRQSRGEAHGGGVQQVQQLEWYPVDFERYPALKLGFEVAKSGGTCGAVLNAANEAAVELFLEGKIRLTEIAKICGTILHHHTFSPHPTLEELLRQDRWK
jgi:1-deoxy-D-xylulose 5-phosphate reductoisomerase